MRSPTRCWYPKHQRVINQYGDLRPCCHTHDLKGFNEETVQKVAVELANGIRSKACKACWDIEDLGGRSYRNTWDSKRPDGITCMELNLSNVCNLKCRMCDSGSSSAWSKDHLSFLQDKEVASLVAPRPHNIERAFKTEDSLQAFYALFDFDRLKRVNVLGGEPFLEPQLISVLKHLQQTNGRDITIHITTNLTTLDEAVLEELNFFSKVIISVSIEAIGPMYSYIRGGKRFSHNDIENNIMFLQKNCPNFEFETGPCVGAYNIAHIGELYAWLRQYIEPSKIKFSPIYRPDFLGIFAIPRPVRQHYFAVLKEHLTRRQLKHGGLLKQIKQLFLIEKEHDPKLLQKFLAYTKKLDQLRGESFQEVAPDYLRRILEHS